MIATAVVVLAVAAVLPASAVAGPAVGWTDPMYPPPGYAQDPTAGRSPADLPCEPDGPSIQLVHAVPEGTAGTPQAEAESLLRESARWMNGDLLAGARRAGGGDRQLRFVMTPDCQLDVRRITFRADPGPMAAVIAIRDVLQAQDGGRNDRLYLAWADGHPGDETGSCGLANRVRDDRPAPEGTAGQGNLYGVLMDGCHDQRVTPGPLHELFHMLGAVQESAPHFSGSGHVSDGADLMNAGEMAGATCTEPGDSYRPDCGHDDYFDPAPEPGSYLATHWNSADSPFLVVGDAPPPPGPLTPPAIRFDEPTPASRAAAVSGFRMHDEDLERPGRVLLARDDEVADSLAASTLMGDAVLLYTSRDALSPEAAAELRRLLDRERAAGADELPVTILGGDAAVSGAVEQAVRDIDPGIVVDRLSGPTRIETAIAVADQAADGGMVGVARAAGTPDNPTAGWADAIAAGALLADDRIPLLLTPTDSLHPAVAEWLAARDVTDTFVLGGVAAISEGVAAQLPGTVHRFAGDGRDGTAAAINRAWGDRTPGIAIAFDGYGTAGWVDGLLAAGLASDHLATTLVVSRDAVPPATAALAAEGCDELWVMGTTLAVSEVVASQLAC